MQGDKVRDSSTEHSGTLLGQRAACGNDWIILTLDRLLK